MKPSFPSFENIVTKDDVVDEDDDCIICKKLLLKHSEQQASDCYNQLIKRKLVKVGGNAFRP